MFGKKKKNKKRKKEEPEGMRETVDAIVVAFILAFLFRTFEAEAFVIPTGSMAPTLYGRHKEVDCPECGINFAVGASEEVKAELDAQIMTVPSWPDRVTNNGYLKTHSRIETTCCPNCRYEIDIKDMPVFKGDRILVNKQQDEPKRFDVIVFKYPEQPQINYIKRLVGLPGESIFIKGGDVFARTDQNAEWQILRKDDPEKQRDLQLPVYDDRYPATRLLQAGWPPRWAGMQQDQVAGSIAGWSDSSNWKSDAKARTYSVEATDQYQWLRYRHFVPSRNDGGDPWQDVQDGLQIDPAQIRPRLIADFCSYNAYTTGMRRNSDFGTYWMNDLTLDCNVEVQSASGDSDLMFELCSGYQWFRCHINPSTGAASLTVVNRLANPDNTEEEMIAEGVTSLKGAGSYDISFANVDDRLLLWVNGSLVKFSSSTSYWHEDENEPQQRDLIPIGIAARGASLTVGKLKIHRDIYYRAETRGEGGIGALSEIDTSSEEELGLRLDSPESWAEYHRNGRNKRLERGSSAPSFFKLKKDEFLVLGDNSPRSKDSRLFESGLRQERYGANWGRSNVSQRFAVPRNALIGKAFFIYWPHAQPFMNDGKGFALTHHCDVKGRKVPSYPNIRVPFYPQIGRMKRIR